MENVLWEERLQTPTFRSFKRLWLDVEEVWEALRGLWMVGIDH